MTVTILLVEKWRRVRASRSTGQTTDATVAPTTAKTSGPQEKKQDALQATQQLTGSKVKHEIVKDQHCEQLKKRIAVRQGS